jgi:hypothetical protein
MHSLIIFKKSGKDGNLLTVFATFFISLRALFRFPLHQLGSKTKQVMNEQLQTFETAGVVACV